MEPLAEPGLQNVRVGLVIASGEEKAGVGECSRSPRSRLPLRTARVAGLKRCGATRPLPPRPTEVPTGSRRSGLLQYWPERGIGVARAPSPDARSGHPWPPLARTRLRFALRAALVGYAGSRSTGDPSLQRKALCIGLAYQRSGEAGIGERLRSDEVLRETTKLLPAPPTNDPPARGPLGWLKRCFWIASAASSTTHSGNRPGTER